MSAAMTFKIPPEQIEAKFSELADELAKPLKRQLSKEQIRELERQTNNDLTHIVISSLQIDAAVGRPEGLAAVTTTGGGYSGKVWGKATC